MTAPRIEHGFILAAGLGTRLRPYTDHCPKPLVKLGGRPIIDHVLDRLRAAGVTRVTVNLHYMADMLAEHLRGRDDLAITLSFEETLLDTGGGVLKALPATGGAPFYCVSGDSVWEDGPDEPALRRMNRLWHGGAQDALLLLQPLDRMILTPGRGDYNLGADGRVKRAHDRTGAFMWTSVRLCHPRLFDGAPAGAFSFLDLLDRAEGGGRLRGLAHDGAWYHITSAEDLDRVNAALVAA